MESGIVRDQISSTLTSFKPIVGQRSGYKLVYRTIGTRSRISDSRFYTCPAGTDSYTEWRPGETCTVKLTDRPLELCHNALHYSLDPLGTWQYFSPHPAAVNVFREQRLLSMHHVDVPLGTEIAASDPNTKMTRSDRLKRGAWRLTFGQPVTGAAFWPTDRNLEMRKHYIASGTVGCCLSDGLLHSLPLSTVAPSMKDGDEWMLPSHVDHSYNTLTFRWSVGGHNVLSTQRRLGPSDSNALSSALVADDDGSETLNGFGNQWRRYECPELDWPILLFHRSYFDETARAFVCWQQSGTRADLPLALGLQMQFVSAIVTSMGQTSSIFPCFSQLMSELVIEDGPAGITTFNRTLKSSVFDNHDLMRSLFRRSILPFGSLTFEHALSLFGQWLRTLDNSFTAERLQKYFAPCLADDRERAVARQIVAEIMED